MIEFSDITTRNELAEFLGVPRHIMTYVLYVKKVDAYYQSFEIPKKNGETRRIKASTGELKSIQKKLAEELCNHQLEIREVYHIKSNISHGFEKEKGIITNANIHRNKRYVLNVDLQDFFDSFHFGRVKGFFEKNKYFGTSTEVATIIAQLTCFQGCLPQGAPTSPIITNLICQVLDNRLLKIAKKHKLDYSRYADDLTFSTNYREFAGKQQNFLIAIQKEIERAGFKINEKKTRFIYKDSQQKVTGLVVNKKINVSQEYYRETRAMAHSLYTCGKFTVGNQEGTIEQLEGRFAFINQLSRHNNKLDKEIHEFGNLNGREQEFKRFLFYKYFYGNEMPVIVTEGKTDVRYLKSALKAMYKDYPNLITRSKDGHFVFKLTFLKRTKRLQYFLGIRLDGADTIQNIYRYFVDGKARDEKRYPNYFKYFMRMDTLPQQPVILMFDNELDSKRPLRKFLSEQKFSDAQIEKLKSDLYLKAIEVGKVYLLTNPLTPGKKECEIECLFSKETLGLQIGGKSLCLKDDFDTTKYYGKEIFSQYISDNYESIDFSGFRTVLDKIDAIIKNG